MRPVPDRPWTLCAEEPPQPVPATHEPMLELDPRRPALTLAWRGRSGGGPELWYGAVIRRVLPSPQSGWASGLAWLESPAGQALLDQIRSGYHWETRWTGDIVGSWSPDAAAAVDAMVEGLTGTLTPS